jgi:hypothetical protein
MKRGVLAAAVLAAAFGISLAAQGGAEKAQMEIDAAFARGDKARYEEFLVDDGTWVETTGRLRDKKIVLAELPQRSTAITVGVNMRSYAGGAVLKAVGGDR